jgi:hypothetical protein
MIEAMDLEKFHRYLTRAQNAMTKGIQGLALLKETLRIEQERAEQSKRIVSSIQVDTIAINALPGAANASTFTDTRVV